jgi:hypothetical protein
MTMSGDSPDSFLFPLLLSASVLTFLLSLIIAVSANEDEIRADASLSQRLGSAADAQRSDETRTETPVVPDTSRDDGRPRHVPPGQSWRRIRDSNS